MFTRLVSQLSLSPSAVSQLTFYGRRLAREGTARRFTAVAAVLILLLQSAVVLFPPTPINAASPADVIYGGIISKDDLLNRFDENAELRAVFSALSINRQDLEVLEPATISSSDRALKILGRLAHSSEDFEVPAAGRTFYMQPLHAWDTPGSSGSSDYAALQGQRSSDGSYFAVLMRGGNPVGRTYPATPLSKSADLTLISSPTPSPTPSPTATPKSVRKTTPTPAVLTCVSLKASATSGVAPLQTTFTATPVARATGYIFDFGDGSKATSGAPSTTHSYATAGEYTATLQLTGASNLVSAPVPACTVKITATGTPASYTKSKSAVNVTQNIDATTSPAAGGDLIRYRLSTKNIGGTAGSYSVVEHLDDVLEYADIVDAGGATSKDSVLVWPAQTILPGATLTTEFSVRIKNPIPSTPIGLSDKFSYDLRLDNVYGNAVRIDIAPPASKQIEIASAALPRTSTSTASAIIILVCLLALYFYVRNRQLRAEIKILRGEFDGGL